MKRLLLVSALPSLLACEATVGLTPPKDQIFFPVGLAASQDGQKLYLSNGNFNASFDGGTVTVLDLAAAETDGLACLAAQESGSAAPANCQLTAAFPPTLCVTDDNGICRRDDRSISYIDDAATVQIASFAGDFLQTQDGSRLYFTVRGDESLSFVDVDPAASGQSAIFCDQTAVSDGLPHCGGSHVLLAERDSVLPEFGTLVPDFDTGVFGLALDLEREVPGFGPASLLYVSHLDLGEVSVFLQNADGTLSFQQSQLVATGVNQIAVHPLTGLLYVARRDIAISGALVNGNTIELLEPRLLGTDNKVSLRSAGNLVPSSLDSGGTDYRSLLFSRDGTRLFVGQRNPSSVMIFDTSLDTNGRPRNSLIARIDVDQIPQQLRLVETEDGGQFLYAADFDSDRVHVIDVSLLDGATASSAVRVGANPFGMTFAVVNGAPRVIVANFNEDNLSVIDADPSSPRFQKVLYRIGAPRLVEE